MISYNQEYWVIKNTETNQVWDGKNWRTPVDRLDILMCTLDDDDLQEDYAEQLLVIPKEDHDIAEIVDVTVTISINF